MMPLVFELSVFIYYIYLMLSADSLSATVLSPAGVIVGGPVPLVGRIGPDEHLHVKKSCLRRCVRWKEERMAQYQQQVSQQMQQIHLQ
jgi:hypothetical protein